MSQKENNKKDPLEQFFKKKAGEHDIPFREEDWLELDKKLEARRVVYLYRKKVAWMTAAAVILIAVLGFFTYDSYNRLNHLGQQLNEWVPPATEGRSATEESLVTEENSSNDNITGNAELTELNDEQSGIAADGSPEQMHMETSPPSPEDLSGYPDISRLEALTDYDVYGENEFTGSHAAGLTGWNGRPGINRIENSVSGIREPVLPAMEFIVMADTSVRAEYLAVYDPDPEIGPGSEIESGSMSAPGIENHGSSRFSAGIMLSPDLSTVGSISDFYDPGYKIGVTGEYRLNTDFSITAGIIQSKVRYRIYSGDPDPYMNGSGSIVPDETVGVCLILDIPINIRYSFWDFSNSRLFATAGISSYIMLNEDYQFIYRNGAEGSEQGWSGRTGSRHWASNAGFSIGYEMDLHPRWSLRAEPFIKVPLREVGWGNVRLYSIGSFLSLNYNF